MDPGVGQAVALVPWTIPIGLHIAVLSFSPDNALPLAVKGHTADSVENLHTRNENSYCTCANNKEYADSLT